LTCAAIVGDYVGGIEWNPAELNAILTYTHGYASSNLLIWAAISEIYGMKLEILAECPTWEAPVETDIKDYRDRGLPIITRVDTWKGRITQEHWVVLLPPSETYFGKFTCVDPQNGYMKAMLRPALTILGWAVYSKL
jgi:hypothetical protein